MAHKTNKEYQPLRIKALCIKWEAIRRSTGYKRAYQRYCALRAFRLPKKDSLRQLIKWNRIYLRFLDKAMVQWCMIPSIDPSTSYQKEIFSTATSINANQVPIDELILMFKARSAVVDRSHRGFRADNLDTIFGDTPKAYKELRGREYDAVSDSDIVTLQIDVSRNKKQLLFLTERIIDVYKQARTNVGIDKPSQKRRRFRIEDHLDIFDIYDLVEKRKSKEIEWLKLASKFYGNRKGVVPNKPNIITVFKNSYYRAKHLIDGGFRVIG